MNPGVNDVGMDQANYITYRKDSDLVHPGAVNLWVFIDENPRSINDAFFLEMTSGGSNPPQNTQWTDIPATYHNHAGGISFADGHAQIRKWTDEAILGFNLNSAAINGTTARGNTDIDWLLKQTTAHK